MRRLGIIACLSFALLLGACDSDTNGSDTDDDFDFNQDPGTFSAGVEGTISQETSGNAWYGIHTDPDTGDESFWILLHDPFGGPGSVVVMARSGDSIPGQGDFRIGNAPQSGITGGANVFFGYYTNEPPANIRRSSSGSIEILDFEDGELRGRFHFAAANEGTNDYVSIIGNFSALENDDIESVVELDG